MKSLENIPVLVTGATGFVGSRLSEQLSVKEKASVTGIGRNLDRVSYLKNHGVNLQSADLMNTDVLRELVDGKEIVFHTAAALGADPETAQKVNVEATETLVKLAGEAGVSRFVHISTVGVYDMKNLDEVVESAPLALNHSSTYPRTKAEAEKRAIEMASTYDMELSIVRPSMIYGPGHGIWSEGMFKNILEGKPVMLGDGSAHFNPVYIDDVVDAIIRCSKHPKAAGEAFNVSAEITTWREFMSHYGDLCGKEPKGVTILIARLMAFANKIPGITTPIDRGFIEMATSRKKFPIQKAADLIDWEPKVSLEEGLKRTTEWLDKEVYKKS
ncbi:NAD(P)-dependent oxidoreductase [Rhodohalobacter sp.]|uniref:NAD-dependent epimerase/dehydratase family protein n=1 Tax=Rhodohalobacter sp. TaxID=1974210 RepID=UPI002ACE78D8|nr:NAD(P)-dependent oxidoreductase [Rhodohalobacter sp.]MDZ7757721.1 NAD(P)-dependent oxidoreductase [Rhodohalobacter sp.]